MHQRLPYLQGMSPQLTKSFSRAPAEPTCLSTIVLAIGLGLSPGRGQRAQFHTLPVGQKNWRITQMSNQVVLITGGLTGIGRAAAVAFAKKGSKVVVAGRRDEVGKALAKELRSLGSEAEFINADVRKEDDIRNAVDKTVARFGRLDVAVNNAATEGQVGPITDQTAESYAQ